MGFLPAVLPSSFGPRGETLKHLTQRVGWLFGVDATRGPGGQVWIAQYDALTLGEIARGGPLPTREWHKKHTADLKKAPPVGESISLPADTWWIVDRALLKGVGPDDAGIAGALPAGDVHEIAASTLNRLLPDRKAAAVLQGTNLLLEQAEATVRAILAALVEGLAPRAVLALWAILVQEVYRSQPALFAAAVQARAIQRALTLPWAPTSNRPLAAARSEFGSSDVAAVASANIDRALTTLRIIDDTLPESQVLFGGTGTTRGVDESRNRAFLRDDLIARWTRHLLHSDDRGYVWIEEREQGVRTAEALVSTLDSVIGFVAEQHGAIARGALDALASPQSMCPDPPGAAALEAMEEHQRAALVWALVQFYRVLRQEAIGDPAFRRHVTACLAATASLAEDVLGEVHLMTLWAKNRHAEASHADSTEDQDAAGMRDAGMALLASVAAISELRRAGGVPSGFFAESLLASSMALRKEAAELESIGEPERAIGFRQEVGALWRSFFATLGVEIDDILVRLTDEAIDRTVADAEPSALALHSFLHNYTAYLIDSPDPDDHKAAARLMHGLILPARARLAKARGLERGYRLSVQVAIQAAERLLVDDVDELTDDERLRWAERAARLTQRLRDFEVIGALLADRGELRETDRLALTRLVAGAILSHEWGHEIDGFTLDEIGLQLRRLVGERDVDGPGVSVARAKVAQLVQRYERLTPVGRMVRSRGVMFDLLEPEHAAVGVRGEGAPDGPTAKREVVVDDETLFEALRGTARKFFEPPLAFQIEWEQQGGTLSVELVLPFLDARVNTVHVTVTSDGSVMEVPLAWERVPGQIVRLRGAATASSIDVHRATLEVIVRVDD